MKNLAGNKDCDLYIRDELTRARIDVVELGEVQKKYEVPFSVIGRLGAFEFKRNWYYWVVEGPMPMELAKELYADPVGRTDIRVDGDAGRRPPEEAYHWDPEKRGKHVYRYHVDTEIGLRLLADTIRRIRKEAND